MSYFTETLNETYNMLQEMNAAVFTMAYTAGTRRNLEYTNAKGKKYKGEMAYQVWSTDLVKPLGFSDRYKLLRKCEKAADECVREKQYNLNKVKITV